MNWRQLQVHLLPLSDPYNGCQFKMITVISFKVFNIDNRVIVRNIAWSILVCNLFVYDLSSRLETLGTIYTNATSVTFL